MRPQVEPNRVQNTLALRSGERAREAMDGLWARGERTKHLIPTTKLQRNPGIETPKTKLQPPKKSQVPSSKPQPALRAWSLELLWSLELGVWSLLPGLLDSQKLRYSRPLLLLSISSIAPRWSLTVV